jgi:2-iminobutanoate/2-iminopropanoate deaminase
LPSELREGFLSEEDRIMINCSRSAMWIVGGAAFAVILAAAPGCAQGRRAVNLSEGAQSLPFSDGIVAGNTLYVSGQQGTDSSGKLRAGITGQTEATLERIKRVISKAGFEMNDVVTVNVYLSDVADFPAMNKVYRTFFAAPMPARATIQAGALVNGAKVEISVIAVKE